jgi:hypothetical protein
MVENADGAWRVYEETPVKAARKEHRCDDCNRKIQVGEPYLRAFGLYDGAFNLKHCQQCTAAIEWLNRICGGWLWNAVAEDLADHWQEHVEFRTLALRRLIHYISKGWLRNGTLIPSEDVQRWAKEGADFALAAANAAGSTG